MTNHLIITTIAQELGLKADQIVSTVQLFDEDNTLPFIARYRRRSPAGWTRSSSGRSRPV